MKPSCAAAFVLALVCSNLTAQQFHVAPSNLTDAEGNTMTWLPGCAQSGAKQIILSGSHLQPMIGHTILGLAFRRDGTSYAERAASDAQLVVRVGATSRDPIDPATDFGANLPQPQSTLVFSGTLSIPQMPPIQGYVGWVMPHVVEIPFSAGFLYQGGNLAIELEGTTATEAHFAVDAVDERVNGTVVNVGQACGPRSATFVNTAMVSGLGLIPGGTSQLHLAGTDTSAAFAFFGVSLLPQPVDLAFLGAPGCSWHVDSFTALGAAVVPSGIEGFGSLANVGLHLPGTPTLLGGRLFVQWLEVGQGTLATSQAMSLTISGQMPSLGMAQLERLSDGSVHVAPGSGPVIGFRWL